MKKFILSLALICTAAASPRADDYSPDARGTAALGFLKVGAGARAAALGGAYTALGDDASALYWNPAGLLLPEKNSLVLMRAAYIGDVSFNYAAYSASLKGVGAFGASLDYMSAGQVAETDDQGFATGTMNPSDSALSLGFARALGGWGFGGSYKFIKSKLKNSASVHAFDAGLISPRYLNGRLNFGAALLNLGGTIKYEAKAERLPFVAKAGAAYQVSPKAGFSADICFPVDEAWYAAVGAEFRMYSTEKMKFFWRSGFNTGTIGDFGGFNGFSAGVGLSFKDLRLDYAAVPMGVLGLSNRFSLTLGFK